MPPINFQNCSEDVSVFDLDSLEKSVGMRIPKEFRDHYLKFNGGMPSLDWFPAQPGWEPIWIHRFLPIEAAGSAKISIGSIYETMRQKNAIPENILPFALDPGGNFICLNLRDGTILYHVNDVFDPTISITENHKKAERKLVSSFSEFIALLVNEDDAYD
jgi:cell wall assembly regulator SMI1